LILRNRHTRRAAHARRSGSHLAVLARARSPRLLACTTLSQRT
jgi:hypothetical protein